MKKNDNINITIIVIIILIILGGTFIVVRDYLNRTKNHYTFKGANGEEFNFEIFKIENNTIHRIYLEAFINGVSKKLDYGFHYSPYDVEDIYLENNIKNKILNKETIYLSFDPDTPEYVRSRMILSIYDIGQITGTSEGPYIYGLYNINTRLALTRLSTAGNFTMPTDTPIKSCKDATENVAVIEIRLGDKTKIYSEEECVIIEGTDRGEIVKAADKLTYQLLGLF